MPEPGPLSGATLELTVGGPAHGGSCVARHPDPDGRVVFVRHALPGERVRAVVTEDRGGSFALADAVEVLRPSPDRVEPPCPYAGPGRCGGCDWQHASGPAQRELKASVVREQFAKLARLDVAHLLARVEELPGGLLGWRTRNLYAVGRDGRTGLRAHRSHEVVPTTRCLLGAPGVDVPPGDAPAGATGVELARGTGGSETSGALHASVPGPDAAMRAEHKSVPDGVAVLAHRPGRGRQSRGRRPPDQVELVAGPATLRHRVLGRDFEVAAGGFWQVHPVAAETFAAALLDAVRPRAGEKVLDLYAGAGVIRLA